MHQLPAPILGDITAITITSPDLELSLQYYRRLGFSEVMRADWPFPWIQVSDGVLLIMLRKDSKPYLALTYYVKQIENVAAALESDGIQFSALPKKNDPIKRYLIKSPDGLNISLVSMVDGFRQPPGPGMLHMDQQDYFDPGKYINKTSGMFGELAHPVGNLEESIQFWRKLGFVQVSRFTTPYPWAILSDGLAIVGLHQTTQFDCPAITYFAVDMREKANRLIAEGLTDYTEQGPSNLVLSTPEQQRICLFKLGGDEVATHEPGKTPAISWEIIETARLRLKMVTPDLEKRLFEEHADEELLDIMGFCNLDEVAMERNNCRAGLATYRTSFRNFLVEEKSSGMVIGKCGFHTWYLQHKRAEIGYAISNRSYEHQGYMKEAMEQVIAYGFETMELNRIEAFVGPGNAASLALMNRFGFTKEGMMRSHYFKNGKFEDSVCFSLLREEYKRK